GFLRLNSWLGSDHGNRSLSPKGCAGTITEMGGGRSSCVLLGQRAPTPTSSCRSPGERQFNLGNCVVARDAIICLELESDTRVSFADEERCFPRCGDAFYVTLGQNARAYLPFCGPQNKPDKHHLSRREVLSALSDRSAILLLYSC